MGVIKRRVTGGRKLHFVRVTVNGLEPAALCGRSPTQGTRVWLWPGETRDNMMPHREDCPKCVDKYIKAGGQFS